MVKIGKGVCPEDLAPPSGKEHGRPVKYPVDRLDRGEHLVVELDNRDEEVRMRKVKTLQRAISRFRKARPERTFVVRYSPEENALYVIRTDEEN